MDLYVEIHLKRTCATTERALSHQPIDVHSFLLSVSVHFTFSNMSNANSLIVVADPLALMVRV